MADATVDVTINAPIKKNNIDLFIFSPDSNAIE